MRLDRKRDPSIALDVCRQRLGQCFCAAVLTLLTVSPAFGHEGKPHHTRDLIYTWGLDPLVLASLTLSGGLYFLGVRQVWQQAGTGRGIKRWEVAAYAAGWFALVIALVSPLHPLGEVLFSAHMTQHELLMLVAAPLTVLGKPLIAFLWALPVSWSRRLGRWTKAKWFQNLWAALTKPLNAWAIHAVSLWVWHAPSLFQSTLSSNLVHTVQHIFFLGSALLFWWALIHGPHGAMGYGVAALYVFTTSVHSGALGALLTFAGTVVYPVYSQTTGSWGLTALEDQQLGGLIMWVPAGLVYIIAGLALCAGWLRESERVTQTVSVRTVRCHSSQQPPARSAN
jgi:putative membrane protein